ncbi:MAG: hypothetical protein WBB07_16095 [Mycobacterium sp.]
MHISARSYLTAGVAFIGAGAIAVSPISPINPSLPDIVVPAAASSTPVELTAIVNPIELWAQTIATAAGNLGTLAETFLADPAPILAKIAQNGIISASTAAGIVGLGVEGFFNGVAAMPAAFQAAIDQIIAGDFENGIPSLGNVLLLPIIQAAFPIILGTSLGDIVALLQNPFDNISNVIGVLPQAIGLLGLPLLGLVISPLGQVGLTVQAIFDGITTGDFEAALNAVISFPSDLVGTIVNGNPNFGGGLLGEYGIVEGLLNFRNAVANAITPPAVAPGTQNLAPQNISTPAADEVPDPAAITVSLSTGPEQAAPQPEPAATAAAVIEDEPAAEPAPEPTAEPASTAPIVEETEPEAPAPAPEEAAPVVSGGTTTSTDGTERTKPTRAERASQRAERTSQRAERASEKERTKSSKSAARAASTNSDNKGDSRGSGGKDSAE